MRTHLLRPLYPAASEIEPDTGCACNDDRYAMPRETLLVVAPTPTLAQLARREALLEEYELGGYAGI